MRSAFAHPPPGCALGIAGPTLAPATALHGARDAAVAALAAERLGVALHAEVSWVGRRVRERADERADGVMHGVWIAGLRSRPGGGVDALACVAGAGARHGSAGPWPPRFSRAAHCGVGVAGPGLGLGDQARAARRDAREMLARAVETRVEHRLSLDGGRRVDRDHRVEATASARLALDAVEEALEERHWADDAGRGPLGRPGLLYVELCLPDAR